MSAPRAVPGFRPHAGLSLVELLIALTLGLMLLAAVIQLFAASARTYAVAMSQARLQEDARVALEIMARAARGAGYLGCNARPADLLRGLRGAWHHLPEYDVTRPVQGFAAAGAAWRPGLEALPRSERGVSHNVHIPGNGIDTRTLVRGSDVVVFRRLGDGAQRLAEPLWPDGQPLITAPGGDPGFAVGDVVMIADCMQAAVFLVTGVSRYGHRARLLHDVGSGGSRFENAAVVDTRSGPAPFTLSGSGRPYGPEAVVAPVISTWFFVAPSAGRDAQGETVPALWHKLGSGRPVELVQGVARLEVWFGVATVEDAAVPRVERYVRPDHLVEGDVPQTVVAVRILVTLVARDAGHGAAGSQRTFARTVMLRNAAPPVPP